MSEKLELQFFFVSHQSISHTEVDFDYFIYNQLNKHQGLTNLASTHD